MFYRFFSTFLTFPDGVPEARFQLLDAVARRFVGVPHGAVKVKRRLLARSHLDRTVVAVVHRAQLRVLNEAKLVLVL